ncbi:MAG: hypothetical protein KBA95_19520 [Acidobacteria bacterium]|nr:hypothetical protein [Acidobacteriota bacterium]
MHDPTRDVLTWTPRVLGILVSAFLAVFALDVFDGSRAILPTLLAFVIHAAPSIVLLATVIAAWRYPWVGAVAFIGLALFYAARVHRVDWVLVISGPLLIVGVLFLLSAVLARGQSSPS